MNKITIFLKNNLLFIAAILLQILNLIIYLNINSYNSELFKTINIIILLSSSLIKLYRNNDYHFKNIYIFYLIYLFLFFYFIFAFENKYTTLPILYQLSFPISFLFYLSSYGLLFGPSFLIFILIVLLILNFFITFIPYIIFKILHLFINYIIKKRDS